MGCYLSAPDDRVFVTDGRGKNFRYATASCQGWRREQEDAEDCLPGYDDDASLFVLCDGHGGPEVAKYTVKHFPSFLRNHRLYQEGNYEKALEEAFIEFDLSLRDPKAVEELERLAMDNDTEKEQNGNGESLSEDKKSRNEDTEMDAKDDGPNVGSSGQEAPSSSSAGGSSGVCAGLSAGPSTSAGPSSSNGPISVVDDVDGETLRKESLIPIEELISKYSSPVNLKGRVQSLRHGSLKISGSPVIRSQRDDDDDDDSEDFKKLASSSREGKDDNRPGTSRQTFDWPTSSSGTRPELELISKALQQYFKDGDEDDDDEDDDSEFEVSEVSDSDDDDDDDQDEEEEEDEEEEGDEDEEGEGDEDDENNGHEDLPTDSEEDVEDGDDEREEEIATSEKSKSKRLRKKHRRLSLEEPNSSEDGEDTKKDGGSNDEASGINEETSSSNDDESGSDEDESDEDEEYDKFEGGDEWAPNEEDVEYWRNRQLISKQLSSANRVHKPGTDSGCTVVVGLVKNGHLYVASAGDSRLILIARDGRCKEMTFDHKPEDEKELRRIKAANGAVVEGRVNGGLNLSRAFGDFNYKDIDLDPRKQMITPLPEVYSINLDLREWEYIFLACDGIWNSMSNAKVAKYIFHCRNTQKMDLVDTCVSLFRKCLAPSTDGDGTGCDNMTCILVKYYNEGENMNDPQITEQKDLKATIKTTDGSGGDISPEHLTGNNNQGTNEDKGANSKTGKRAAESDDETVGSMHMCKKRCYRLLKQD